MSNSMTPETDAMMETDAHRIEEYSAPLTAYRRICDLARTLERERDEWRKKAVDLHARHKGALEDFKTERALGDKLARALDRMLHLHDNGTWTGKRPDERAREMLKKWKEVRK